MNSNINILRAKCLIEAADILNEAGAQQRMTGMKRDQLTKINQKIDKLKRNNGSKEEILKLQSKAKELQSWLDKYGTPSRKAKTELNKNIGLANKINDADIKNTLQGIYTKSTTKKN